jgi:hypothetical protein
MSIIPKYVLYDPLFALEVYLPLIFFSPSGEGRRIIFQGRV